MILVTVGTHFLPFDRLIKKMDDIAGKIEEEVIMQIGNSSYTPKHANFFHFKELEEMEQLIKEARVVVTHGGAGTILLALAKEKIIICVPRLKEFNEVLVDHQLDLVYNLANEKKIIAVYNLDLLEKSLNDKPRSLGLNSGRNGKLVNFLKRYINTMIK